MNTKIIKLEETDSTNTYLKNYSPSDDEEMVVAVADYQTAGRGQGTHAWESERGKNLLFSILVRPVWVPVTRQFLLSMAGAIALKDVLDTYTEGITLKWPNDVFLGGHKLGGILSQMASLPVGSMTEGYNDDNKGADRIAIIFGIGLNLAIDAEYLPTAQSTSLQLHYAPLPDAESLRDIIAPTGRRRICVMKWRKSATRLGATP